MRIFYGMPKDQKKLNNAICLEKILYESRYKKFFRAITSTSNLQHYNELNQKSFEDNKYSQKQNNLKKFKYAKGISIATNPYGIEYKFNWKKHKVHLKMKTLTLLKRIKIFFTEEFKLIKLKNLYEIVKAGFD